MSSSDDSSPDPELLEVVNQYRTAVEIEENTYDERLNKESEEFGQCGMRLFRNNLTNQLIWHNKKN